MTPEERASKLARYFELTQQLAASQRDLQVQVTALRTVAIQEQATIRAELQAIETELGG